MNRGLLPDVVAYGILIRGFCAVGRLAEARMFYDKMVADGVKPDSLVNSTLAEYLNNSAVSVGEPKPNA
ncbi:putative pentatricopeptide repeat-containing protein [Cocos nucifera]|uniref:Putative pentatricopeptide repeat-containing protein n=1 Tax=Cocos nucifera TaxID=13894 RepID=A0A8K0N8U4_COCNU|nr:putative pentatricopeptide repeat-containing protein [Cocos nucifera]